MTLKYRKVKIIYSDWKLRSPQLFEGVILDMGPFYVHVTVDPDDTSKELIILAKDIRGIEFVQKEEDKEEELPVSGNQSSDRASETED